MRSLEIFIIALSLISVYAYDNNPPIPGRKPGYTFGTGPSGIEVELFYDLLCSDTKASDPIF